MRTLLPDPPPAEIEAILERRRRAGADRRDEVWEGVLHMAPAPLRRHAELQAQIVRLLGVPADSAGLRTVGAFNLGHEGDYRVPDAALLEPGPDALYVTTAALVVEILSPGDESWEKLPFYASRQVDELLIVDPQKRSVDWLALAGGEYRPVQRSSLIDLGRAELSDQIDWPPAAD
jgi:Uma2 family endonuclease